MQFVYKETFLAEVLRDIATSRGTLSRWKSLVEAREDDGLDLADAQLDAGEALGFLSDLETALQEGLEPLLAVLDESPRLVQVGNARATMPTLSVEGHTVQLDLIPSSLQDVALLTRQLAERMAAAPERATVTVVAGLGGTGGCAAGDCLPEDAAPGPLFEQRS